MNTDDFFGADNLIKPAKVPPEHEASIENWLSAIRGRQIGFLPRATSQGLYWYAFAPTMREQKELLTLLDAWIGPTFSDLPRSRGRLYPWDPFDAPLAGEMVPPLRFEVLPRGSGQSRDEVRNALLVLSRLVWRRPTSEFDSPRATVDVLDDLGHAIGAQDRRIALACLRELEATADLDQTNLAFLRLRVYAGLEDWSAIFTDQDLEHVLQLRRPLGISRLLQQAVYERFLAVADLSGNPDALRDAAQQIPLPFRELTTGAVPTARPAVVVEFLLALFAQATSATLDRIVDAASALTPALGGSLRALLPVSEPIPDHESKPTLPPAPDAELRAHIDAGEFAAAIQMALAQHANVARAKLLLFCIRELEEPELAAKVAEHVSKSGLRQALNDSGAVTRSDLAWLDKFLIPQRTLGWLGWFKALKAGSDTLAGVDLNSAADWDVLDHFTAANLLGALDDEALARLGEQGGSFMAAHRSLFTETDGAELCERVLAGLALSSKNSAGVRVQTVALLEYLADGVPLATTLTLALEWTDLIVEGCLSAVTANWAVDVLQAATSTPLALASDAKSRLFYRTLEQLRPIRSALDLTSLEGLRIIAEEMATELPDDFEVQNPETDPASPYLHLANSTVVLYSLTESAITRSAQILRRLVPGIDVRTNSEHDGSKQLASLSASADVFVMVTASAKHAATDFIKESRGGRPLIQINSRGSSAILRELAEG